ncbi:aerobic-type carbon monoxide dehydrogenase small subunit (CoxS/CutS family) [Bradyrhizobium japonicum]
MCRPGSNIRFRNAATARPAQIMQAISLLGLIGKPTDEDINEVMSGNLCRCGTYPRIRTAIHAAAVKMAGK